MGELETCTVCKRTIPFVPPGSDVPIPYLHETTTGRLFCVACVEDHVLAFVLTTPGVLPALRVVRAAMFVPSHRPVFTDEGT